MALNLEQSNGGSFALGKAGLAVGSTASQLSITTAVPYTLDGIYQTNRATSASFVATIIAPNPNQLSSAAVAAQVVPIGSKCAWGVWVDSTAAGANLTVTQGLISPVTSNTDKVAPPPNPGSRVLIGVFTTYAATATFTLGTTALTAGLNAGVNVTYFDTMTLPAVGF